MARSFRRSSGVLLHPTSLPGPFPVGDLGPEAYKFVDFLAAAGQRFWQILPLSPTGDGGSPYSAFSAFAGNTLLVSPEILLDEGLIDGIPEVEDPGEWVHFKNSRELKDALLSEAFEKFRSRADHPLAGEYKYFSRSNAWWLDDYALFRTLRRSHGDASWHDWPDPLKLREPGALAAARSHSARDIEREKFSQYIFFRQWLALKRYANEKGVQIIGDIPIFVAHDSADVWCNRESFKLEDGGSPTVVAGVPPDFFSSTGQRWGNPIYDWQAMSEDGFNWWTARIAFTLETIDVVRLDHFIGFARNWEVPNSDDTAENGQWADVPGDELFTVLNERLGELPVIVEDLGEMTPEIEQLRDKFGFPGMRILQFAFGSGALNTALAHNHIQNCVTYTATHDNDTTRGWYRTTDRNARHHFREYTRSNGREPHWDMIRLAASSVAMLAIAPAQDLLGLGSEARMNTPGTNDGNWSWRLKDGELTPEIASRLLAITKLFGRTDQ